LRTPAPSPHNKIHKKTPLHIDEEAFFVATNVRNQALTSSFTDTATL
jgi:hypothetical protein